MSFTLLRNTALSLELKLGSFSACQGAHFLCTHTHTHTHTHNTHTHVMCAPRVHSAIPGLGVRAQILHCPRVQLHCRCLSVISYTHQLQLQAWQALESAADSPAHVHLPKA